MEVSSEVMIWKEQLTIRMERTKEIRTTGGTNKARAMSDTVEEGNNGRNLQRPGWGLGLVLGCETEHSIKISAYSTVADSDSKQSS